MNNLLEILLLSIAPVSELRGGIPLSLAYGYTPLFAFVFCTLANIMIIPFIFFFLETLNKLFLRIPAYSRLFHKTVERAQQRIHKKVDKYGYLGLTLFVAIPLPVTGAYSGVLGAWALGMSRKKAFLSIAVGVILAGIIVTLTVYLGLEALSVFYKK